MEHHDLVQRPFHLAIVDEADSILIDEARIPLVIAGFFHDAVEGVQIMARLAGQFKPSRDFVTDDYGRTIHLTDTGLHLAEEALQCGNLYDEHNLELLTRLNCALHAAFLLHRDKDYIVRQGKIELVDEFTGRVAKQRRWPDGLQAALEAKEQLMLQSKGRILNSISLQHFIGHYPKLAGMTATACPAEHEFSEFYGLPIAVIPPHAPCIRRDLPDRIFIDQASKNRAILERIMEAYAHGRPVLVGTSSVSESENLASVLRNRHIPCQVLNAKHDAEEAKAIARAGRFKAVTIATNMAGRGTDIQLGGQNAEEKEIIKALGGLLVIGANKHESSRIDNQLRGRAGRQGDPGESEYFVSLEDNLMKKYRLPSLLPRRFDIHSKTGTIVDPVVKKRIDQLQRIVEGQNLEIRKTLNQYSGLLEQQRKIFFDQRRLHLTHDILPEFFGQRSTQTAASLTTAVGAEAVAQAGRRIMLLSMDQAWSQHLADLSDLREGIHMARLGGQDPLVVFHREAIALFDNLEIEWQEKAVAVFDRLQTTNNMIKWPDDGLTAPAATWTYLINDNPFENFLAGKLVEQLPMALAAGIWWPILMVVSLFRKFRKKKE